MEKSTLTRYGSYFVLDRIGSGGMAEIFRARPADAAANGRIVVLKRILPHIADDPQFLSMFQSEIQISMAFNHSNIIKIHDFGTAEGQPYLTMEYVHGQNLKSVCSAYLDKDSQIPLEMAVYIVERIARGLHYVHTFKNPATGESFRLVHRDVSPQNILVSYEGEIKVIDFGIAKASVLSESHTGVGIIKGKLNYLSPEQMAGQELDARSDVFSLGVVLWEMLTGKKLFSCKSQQSEIAVVQMMSNLDGIQPPSELNASVPPVLDKITMIALKRDPAARYQTAESLAKVLNAFLHTYRPHYSESEMGIALKDLFRNRMDEDSRVLQELNERCQEKILDEAATAGTQMLKSDATGKPEAKTPRKLPKWAAFAASYLATPAWFKLPKVSRTSRLAVTANLVLALAWWLDNKYLIHKRFLLSDVQIYQATVGPLLPKPEKSAKPVVIVQKPVTIVQRPVTVVREIVRASAKARTPDDTILLHLKLTPPGLAQRIRVNRQLVDVHNPFVRVPTDKKLTVEIDRKNARPFRGSLLIRSSQTRDYDTFVATISLAPKAVRRR